MGGEREVGLPKQGRGAIPGLSICFVHVGPVRAVFYPSVLGLVS